MFFDGLVQFAVLLAIVFAVEMACGIAACVYKADLRDMLREPLEQSIIRSDASDIMAWDNVQSKLMCCGVNGPADWTDYSKNRTLRASCCQPNVIDMISKDCRKNPSAYQHKYYQVHWYNVDPCTSNPNIDVITAKGRMPHEVGRAYRWECDHFDWRRHWRCVHTDLGHHSGMLAGVGNSQRRRQLKSSIRTVIRNEISRCIAFYPRLLIESRNGIECTFNTDE